MISTVYRNFTYNTFTSSALVAIAGRRFIWPPNLPIFKMTLIVLVLVGFWMSNDTRMRARLTYDLMYIFEQIFMSVLRFSRGGNQNKRKGKRSGKRSADHKTKRGAPSPTFDFPRNHFLPRVNYRVDHDKKTKK